MRWSVRPRRGNHNPRRRSWSCSAGLRRLGDFGRRSRSSPLRRTARPNRTRCRFAYCAGRPARSGNRTSRADTCHPRKDRTGSQSAPWHRPRTAPHSSNSRWGSIPRRGCRVIRCPTGTRRAHLRPLPPRARSRSRPGSDRSRRRRTQDPRHNPLRCRCTRSDRASHRLSPVSTGPAHERPQGQNRRREAGCRTYASGRTCESPRK